MIRRKYKIAEKADGFVVGDIVKIAPKPFEKQGWTKRTRKEKGISIKTTKYNRNAFCQKKNQTKEVHHTTSII